MQRQGFSVSWVGGSSEVAEGRGTQGAEMKRGGGPSCPGVEVPAPLVECGLGQRVDLRGRAWQGATAMG